MFIASKYPAKRVSGALESLQGTMICFAYLAQYTSNDETWVMNGLAAYTMDGQIDYMIVLGDRRVGLWTSV